jgi:transcription elongation factor SPT6
LNNEWKLPKEPEYDFEAEAKEIETSEAKKQQQQRQTYIKRVIVHPSFYNIGYFLLLFKD